MKRMKGLFLILAVMSVLTGCDEPTTYSAESVTATIVDAETGKPLEGVIIVANWQLEHGTFGGNVPAGQLMVMEAMSDKNGVFDFHAWGPKVSKKGHLGLEDPQLLIYQSGYEFVRLSNQHRGEEARQRSVRKSDWNGSVIKLSRFKGNLKQYAAHLGDWPTVSLETIASEDCNWKMMPNMMAALQKQSRFLNSKGINESFINADSIRTNPEVCGDPAAFFRKGPE